MLRDIQSSDDEREEHEERRSGVERRAGQWLTRGEKILGIIGMLIVGITWGLRLYGEIAAIPGLMEDMKTVKEVEPVMLYMICVDFRRTQPPEAVPYLCDKATSLRPNPQEKKHDSDP